jgi:hypothetical protein
MKNRQIVIQLFSLLFMEHEKADLTPEEQWALSQRMINAFRQPGQLSAEMQKLMNRNLPDEKKDPQQSTLKQLVRYISKPFKNK